MPEPAAAPPGGPTPTPARPAAVPPPASTTDYIVFEATGEKDQDLSFRAKVKAAGRPEAIAAAIEDVDDLKKRVEDPDAPAPKLLALAARNVNPEPVELEVETKRTLKIGGVAR